MIWWRVVRGLVQKKVRHAITVIRTELIFGESLEALQLEPVTAGKHDSFLKIFLLIDGPAF
jgi:hypothetical protein